MAKKDSNKTNKPREPKIYHLVIYDEKTLAEKFNFKLTNRNLFTYIGLIIIAAFIIAFLLLVFTPLNALVPKYEDVKLRSQAIQNRILLDSLKHQIAIRDEFFRKMRIIVMGKDLSQLKAPDSLYKNNFISQTEHDSILKQLSATDNNYFQMLANDGSSKTISSLHFYKPVSGIVINRFDPARGHYGIDLAAKKNEPVLAVLSGTVIMANWNPQNGYVIMIQHPNNLISVYKHNSELLKKEGDHVQAGEPIAIVGNTGENTTGPHLHFELWHNGVPVNPADYIIF